jgi:PPM family protein phosphatase
MNAATPIPFRFSAATGLHRGDRAYQQDQVEIISTRASPGCALAVVADGMGGKSGGRKAADQVLLTARQIFERFVPGRRTTPARCCASWCRSRT